MPLTKLNNKAVANVTTLPVALGDMVLVSSATASSSASIEFDLGSYKEYKFFFVNIHAQNQTDLNLNFSIDNGSNYNVTKTTTAFGTYHYESGSSAALNYVGGNDLAQSTSGQRLNIYSIGSNNDDNMNGYLHLFNPSSTTYVKHFMANTNTTATDGGGTYGHNSYIAGYANTTSALTNIKFQMTSGNIDAGKILMFGIN